MSRRAVLDYLLAIARISIGVIYIYASLDKLAQPDKFSIAVSYYQFLPDPLINLWALAMPAVELAVGLFLVLGIFVKPSSLLVMLMSLSFVIAVTRAWAIGLDIDCGCFRQDGSGSNITLLTVLRDTGLFMLCLVLWLFHNGSLGLGRLIKALR